MENIDLTPFINEWDIFYSKAFGKVILYEILEDGFEFYVNGNVYSCNNNFIYYDIYGRLCEQGEVDLFPSKDKLNWN